LRYLGKTPPGPAKEGAIISEGLYWGGAKTRPAENRGTVMKKEPFVSLLKCRRERDGGKSLPASNEGGKYLNNKKRSSMSPVSCGLVPQKGKKENSDRRAIGLGRKESRTATLKDFSKKKRKFYSAPMPRKKRTQNICRRVRKEKGQN